MLVDQRANYACTEGRWIIGEPFTLADGRQVALLGRTILQGQRASDNSDPCPQPTCLIGLEQTEVENLATMPSVVSIVHGNYGGSTCTLQMGTTFSVGTLRADYLCDPKLWTKQKDARQDVEYWLLGGPMPLNNPLSYTPVLLAAVVRQNVPLTNAPTPVCDKPVCVLYISQDTLA